MRFKPSLPGKKFREYLNDLPEEGELPENPRKNLMNLILWSVALVLLVIAVIFIVTWESGEPKELPPPPSRVEASPTETEEVVLPSVKAETENTNIETEKTGLYYRLPDSTVYEGLTFGMWEGPSEHITRDLQTRYRNQVEWKVIGQRGADYIISADEGDTDPEEAEYMGSAAYYARYDGTDLYENAYLMYLEDPINLHMFASEVFGMESYMQLVLPEDLLSVNYSGTRPVEAEGVLRQIAPDIRIFAEEGSVTPEKVKVFVDRLREDKAFAKPFKIEVKSALMENTAEQGSTLKTYRISTNGSIS